MAKVYQLKITLEGAKPPIWRRIEVLDSTKLEDLHKIIQTTMGWTNGHLHQFIIGYEYYGPPSEWGVDTNDYTGIRLKKVLISEGVKIRYEYDFGDSWLHEVKLEKIKEVEKEVKYPRCIKGKKACPPEDCGGIWGYMELQEILKNEEHEEYEDRLEWLGGEFDADYFNLEEINEGLQSENFGMFSLF